MIKWITQRTLYKPMKWLLRKKLIECGGYHGQANDLYFIMQGFARAGLFTEEQAQDLQGYVGEKIRSLIPNRRVIKVKVRRISGSCEHE